MRAKARRPRKKGVVVTIDGPAASGKSTISRLVANKLKFLYIDTGAMYRALTLSAMEQGVDLKDEEALINLISQIGIDLKNDQKNNLRVMLDERDVTKKIRTPRVTARVFYVARAAGVRKEMVKLQRKITRGRKAVVEGRDIGTIVFPKAGRKFYLDADFKERAKRRYRQLRGKGIVPPALKRLEQEILKRDNCDVTRKVAPLRLAEDATYIDTTNLNINEVVDAVLSYIK